MLDFDREADEGRRSRHAGDGEPSGAAAGSQSMFGSEQLPRGADDGTEVYAWGRCCMDPAGGRPGGCTHARRGIGRR